MKSVFVLIATLIGCVADGGESPSVGAFDLALMEDAPSCLEQGGPGANDVAHELDGDWRIVVYVNPGSGQVTCVDSEDWSPRENATDSDNSELAQNTQGETAGSDCQVCGKEPYPASPPPSQP